MTILLPLVALLLSPAATDAPADCSYDREAMLALDLQAFDQQQNAGWRALQARGCLAEAAELLAAYQAAHPDEAGLLAWHEGQMRAALEQRDAAIALFKASRKGEAEDFQGWNAYVDASIAFLQNDRPALVAARERLAAVPKPEGMKLTMEQPDGKVLEMAWPPNLNVVDGLIACFGKTYKEAYNAPCRSRPSFTVIEPDAQEADSE